jgi:phosphoglycolate phosphatase-like HAD superfamily hydrolase
MNSGAVSIFVPPLSSRRRRREAQRQSIVQYLERPINLMGSRMATPQRACENAIAQAVARSQWTPTAKLSADAKLAGDRTLVVFDYDCTLAAQHMFHILRTEEGQDALADDSRSFYTSIFGGSSRLARVDTMLGRLKAAGATLVILSNGIEEEIEGALGSLGLRGHFSALYGGASQMAANVEDKPQFIARLVFSAGGRHDHVLFADDDRMNFPPAHAAPAPRDTWHLSVAGGGEAPPTTLVGWPAGEGEGGDGLDAADLGGIEALFAPPKGA